MLSSAGRSYTGLSWVSERVSERYVVRYETSGRCNALDDTLEMPLDSRTGRRDWTFALSPVHLPPPKKKLLSYYDLVTVYS